MRCVIHSQLAQPIEIHLAHEVLVLPAHGSAEIEESAKSSAQLQALLKMNHVSISEAVDAEPETEPSAADEPEAVGAEPEAEPAPAPESDAPRRRKTPPQPDKRR
jgi:hypothetical protein